MLERILRVIRLDQGVFAEVEQDKSLTAEAFVIVLSTSLLSALGAGFGGSWSFLRGFVGELFSGIILGWIVWAAITYWIGTRIYDGDADMGEMLRTLGYASAPRLLGLLQIIPLIGWLFVLIGWGVSLVAGFLAVREALDIDTPKAIATVLIGWIIFIVFSIIF